MKKQWILMALVMVLVVGACAAMPVMAEQMIAASADQVDVQKVPVRTQSTLAEGERPEGIVLRDEAQAALEAAARAAYQDVFHEQIPASYHTLPMNAYEEDGDILCMVALMPQGWEKIADALGSVEQVRYYNVGFGSVDAQTGAGKVLSVQRFNMVFDAGAVESPEYTAEEVEAMTAAAKAFAAQLGYATNDVLSTGKVSGSFDKGLSVELGLDGGKRITVFVSEAGEVSGYTLIPLKG